MTDEPMKSDKNNHPSVFLISIGLLATALVVIVAVLINPLLQANPVNPTGTEMPTTGYVQPGTSRQETTGTLATGKIPTGVSLFGIDVSGLAKEELVAATSHLPELIMSRIEIPVQVDGEKTVFSAQGLGIATDYDLVLRQVMAYGQTGTAAEKQQALDEAKRSGVNFTIHTVASMAKITAALLPLKEKVDMIPVNASSVFMPWGYSADGKAYQPDVKKMADAHSVGKSYSRPELVPIDPADKPNAIRYQYWQTDHYVKGYIPADAAISRFLYVPETSGRSLDVEALARQIMAQVESGQYSEIATSCLVIEPSVKIADLKNDTRLIASWTSSYRSHAGTSRNWNVSRMSSFINGAVIQPGQKWSVNKTAGYRTDATALTVGWKKAAGIENGGYTQQVGGGVCQLGSTTFNAAIRAGITIASSTHHTIPSDYIPLGLDATLSSPSPDLVLQNNNPNPFYLVSYVNPKDQNVTVEVYGRLPVDPVHGQVIYDFTSNNRGTRYGTPTMSLFYNATVAPDETVLDELHPVYVYAEPRAGIEIQTYKQIYSLAGKALGDPIPYELHKYPVINGRTYMFGPDPATITPTPTPTPTLTPTPGPTPSPTPSPDKHLNKPFGAVGAVIADAQGGETGIEDVVAVSG